MVLNPNQFALETVQGQLDLLAPGTVISGAVSASQATPIVAGQAVKLEDSAGGVPKFLSLGGDTEDTFGFMVRNIKDINRSASDALEVAIAGAVMVMTAGAAIGRGEKVEVVSATNKVIESAGVNPVVGYALDKAAADGDLIRVYITTPETASIGVNIIKTIQVTATLAEINAGKVLIPGIVGRKIVVTNFVERVTGAFTTGTAVVIESGTTGVDVASSAQAQLTNGAVLVPSSSGVTLGAGFAAQLPVDEGLKVSKTGSDFAGGTSIAFTISYTLV